MQLKVSIVMPVYNEEPFLADAVRSFASQTIANECEFICVDDGSTDRSMSILEDLQLEGVVLNLVVASQQNLGSGVARNKGLELVQGKFVGFLDADDFYPDVDVLQTLYDEATAHGFGAAGG